MSDSPEAGVTGDCHPPEVLGTKLGFSAVATIAPDLNLYPKDDSNSDINLPLFLMLEIEPEFHTHLVHTGP